MPKTPDFHTWVANQAGTIKDDSEFYDPYQARHKTGTIVLTPLGESALQKAMQCVSVDDVDDLDHEDSVRVLTQLIANYLNVPPEQVTSSWDEAQIKTVLYSFVAQPAPEVRAKPATEMTPLQLRLAFAKLATEDSVITDYDDLCHILDVIEGPEHGKVDVFGRAMYKAFDDLDGDDDDEAEEFWNMLKAKIEAGWIPDDTN